MKKKLLLRSIPVCLLFVSCRGPNCDKIPENFGSYQEAVKTIKNSSFKLVDSINVNSQYMKSAYYYSCDGNKGYFVYTATSGSEYYNPGVPIDIWRQFKESNIKDSFYQANMRKYKSARIVDVNIKQ